MSDSGYILALDQGTTSFKTLVLKSVSVPSPGTASLEFDIFTLPPGA